MRHIRYILSLILLFFGVLAIFLALMTMRAKRQLEQTARSLDSAIEKADEIHRMMGDMNRRLDLLDRNIRSTTQSVDEMTH